MLRPDNTLYSRQQVKVCEQQALALYHFDSFELMARAGKSGFLFVKNYYPHVKHLAVFCGSGNNAGDGYILARHAHEEGLNVTVYQCKIIEELPEPARHAAVQAIAAGVRCLWAEDALDEDTELVIDALLGIGVQGPVYGLVAATIEYINDCGLPIVALDIPSGLNADTGVVENHCVKAQQTIAFMMLKVGMYTADAMDHCGQIYCDDLGLELGIRPKEPKACLLHPTNIGFPLKARKKNSHKGAYGHLVVIGGGEGMPGAVAMAAKAALKVGAGSVSIATRTEHVAAILPLVPEAMILGIEDADQLKALLDKASFCILGPGLGESDWAKMLFTAAIASQLPMLIDASGLRLLADNSQIDDNWILTPHPGEAAYLLASQTQVVQQDRFQAALSIQQAYGGTVVLKGAGSLIQTVEKQTFICSKGNPGMASAGMGDILSGIIGGLATQGLPLSQASKLGVWLHAQAGDKVAQISGERGLIATDLLDELPTLLNGINS